MAGDAEWRWCEKCHRAYKTGEEKVVLGAHYCPYTGCNARAQEDSLPWNRLISSNPGYPQEPQPGEVYERSEKVVVAGHRVRNRLAAAAAICALISVLGWLVFLLMSALFISQGINLDTLRTLLAVAFILTGISFTAGICALLLGFIALDQRPVRNGVEAGKWLAASGVVVGALSALLALLLVMTKVMPIVYYLQGRS